MTDLFRLFTDDDMSQLQAKLQTLPSKIKIRIRTEIKDYDRPTDEEYDKALDRVILVGLSSFMKKISGQGADWDEVTRTCQWLGRIEVREGRPIVHAVMAIQIAGRLSLATLMEVGEKAQWPQWLVGQLNDAALTHQAELIGLVTASFSAEQANTDPRLLRRDLLRDVLRPPHEWYLISEQARRIGWPIPDFVTMLAPEFSARSAAAELGDDALVDVDSDKLSVLLPGAATAERLSETNLASGQYRLAIGPTVPIAYADRSLRCARRALALGQRGIIKGNIICWEQHRRTVQLLANDAVAEQLMVEELSPLASQSHKTQLQVMETIGALMDCGRVAKHAAQQLDLHVNSLAERMHKIQDLLGDFQTDPDRWFYVQHAVRVWRFKGRPIPVVPAAPKPGSV